MERCDSGFLLKVEGTNNLAGRDLELFEAARLGSSEAFEELQSRHWRRLYRRIQSITRNHEDTEDALQETFLRAYLALESFEGRSQFSTWLTRIAINSALMLLRRRGTRAEISLETSTETEEAVLPLDVRDTALNPEELYDLRQRSWYVSHAIDKLNINLRTTMTAYIERQYSMKEVAQSLNLSLATVKTRLYRARKESDAIRCAQGARWKPWIESYIEI